FFYLKYFLKGIEATGVEIEQIDIYDPKIRINSCKGCLSCKYSGSCAIDDDAKIIIDKIVNSRLIIFAFPVHFASIPDRLQSLFGRFLVLFTPYCRKDMNTTRMIRRDAPDQKLVFFSTCLLPEKDQFRGCLDIFEKIAFQMGIPILCKIIRPAAAHFVLAPQMRPFLERILDALEKSGSQLAKVGRIPGKLLRRVSSPYISNDSARKLINDYFGLGKEL
ncbi:MAG TPA: NAD(P)H-dependent oxidoreductase, partial [Candidatus Omnitrophota bacterium]|nr:NAD(P)H-dependent oxidoreductase [Candidatus Omnitrophota bacterium]